MQHPPVAVASTYPPQRCGIGAYTAQLTRALAACAPERPPIVLSEYGARDGVDDGVRSVPTFSRTADYGEAILEAASRHGVRVVHVQHAPDIWGSDNRLIRLCEALRARNIRPIVTLHTVHTWGTGAWRGYFGVPAFHRRLGEAADAIIVHGGNRAVATLCAHGVPRERVHALPIGTPDARPDVTRADARAKLDLRPDVPILVSVGFLRSGKRLDTAIRALHRVRRRIPACELILAGAVQNERSLERLYPPYLRALIRWYALDDAVTIRCAFLTDEEVALLYAAADLVLLPYRQRYGSGSMALHTALAARRLPVCSRIPKFAEAAEYLPPELVVPAGDAAAWADAIERGLAQAREPAIQARLDAFARASSWSSVAARHAALYKAVCAGPDAPVQSVTIGSA